VLYLLAPTDFPQPLLVLALSPCAYLRGWRLTPFCSAQSLGERFKTHSPASFVDLLRLFYLVRYGPSVIAIEVRLCLGVVRKENGVRKDWVREHLFNVGNPELILGLVPFAQALLALLFDFKKYLVNTIIFLLRYDN
jgi:hypothetical protein